MKIVFCSAPFTPAEPDPDYSAEVEAALSVGFEPVLIDFEALVHDHNLAAAVRRVPASSEPMPALYRGWMLQPPRYAELYTALHARGLTLINDPAAYTHCHYLPESYAVIQAHTPRTVSIPVGPSFTVADVFPLLARFGERPLIVKDYVKSRKHEWYEACFIPNAADRAAVARVVERFLALQGADLNEGLVFREFVELRPLANHSKSGMPLTQEYRLWFVNGQRFYSSHYWEDGTYTSDEPPTEPFNTIAQNVRSRFFTMDVAQQIDGSWLIVELGDGQVAGLPETADVTTFYQALATAIMH